MALADIFPTVDAFLRWGHRQHEAGNLSAEELVTLAIERYAASPALLESFLRESFYFFALEAVNGRRPLLAEDEPEVVVVKKYMTEEQNERIRMSAKRKAEIIRAAREAEDNPVARFFEKHPTHAVTVPLLMMTREELVLAANNRDSDAIEARRRAELYRRMADKMQPGQVAEEVFTEDEVAKLAGKIMQNVRWGTLDRANTRTA